MVTVQQLIEKLLEIPRHYKVRVSNGPNADDMYKILTLAEISLEETVYIEVASDEPED